MPEYLAFGAHLDSELEFPELRLASGGPSAMPVLLRRGKVRAPDAAPSSDGFAHLNPATRTVALGYPQVGRFCVTEGQNVTLEAEPEVDPALVRHALVGPVMAPLLWQRAVFTLHASVIEVSGRAIALVGASGEGKSSLAAALYMAGQRLVADDIAAIPWSSSPAVVLPGFPRLRMFPDTARAVGIDPEAEPRVHSQLDKCSMRAQRFATDALPLAKIILLATGDRVAVEPLPMRAALFMLLRNTYASQLFAPFVGADMHMKVCAALAGQVSSYRLTRPRSFAALNAAVEAVLELMRSP